MAPTATETQTSMNPRHEGFDAAGSLITVFTFPPSCGPMLGDPWSQDLECALPNWDSYSVPGNGWHMQFYSPAICPDGYSAACTRPTTGILGPEVESDETAWLCLPSGYVCASWTRVGSTTDGEATGTGVAPYVQIRWVESDLSVLETHPLTPGLHLQATEAAFITSTITVAEPTSEKTPVDEDGSSGLSKSAKAGIAVGVSVSLLLYIMAAVLIWRCCRKRQEEKDDSSRAVVTSASPATGQVQQYQGPQEMGYKVVHQPASELATDPIRHQADSQPRAELPGSIEDRPNTVNELATSADVIPKSQAQSPGVVPAISPDYSINQGELVQINRTEPHEAPQIIEIRNGMKPELGTPVPAPALVRSPISDSAASPELASLYRRQSELQARKERLLALKQIEDEQEIVRRRMEDLQERYAQG